MKDCIFGQTEFEPRGPDEHWKVGSLTFAIWLDTQKMKIQREIRDATGETKYSNAIPLDELETVIEEVQKIITKRALERSETSSDLKRRGLLTRFFGKKKAPEKLPVPETPKSHAPFQSDDSKQLEARMGSAKGCREGERRATFIVQEELLERVKATAHWERRSIKDLINEAMESYLNGR